MVDLVPREAHREKRKKQGRVGKLRIRQEVSMTAPDIIRTCYILLTLSKRGAGTRMAGEMMIKKVEDTQAQAEDPTALLQKAKLNILQCKVHHFRPLQQLRRIRDPLPDQLRPLVVLTGELLAQYTRRFLGAFSVPEVLAAPTVQGVNAVLHYLRKGHSALMIDKHPIPQAEQEAPSEGLAVLREGVLTVHNQEPTAQEVPEDAIAGVLRVADRHPALLTIDVLQALEGGGKGLQIVGQVVLEASVLGVEVLIGMIEALEEAIIALPWAEVGQGGPIHHL